MPNYKTGKIYCIRSNLTKDVYIGSTIQTLSRRMVGHRSEHKRWKCGEDVKKCCSTDLFDLDPNCYIDLIENFPCNDIYELRAREGFYQRKTPNCINKKVEGKTKEEVLEENKEKSKLYYYNNKEEIQEKNKEKVTCECGFEVTKRHLSRHLKSEQHLIFKKQQNPENDEEPEKVKCECGCEVRKDGLIKHKASLLHINYEKQQNSSDIEHLEHLQEKTQETILCECGSFIRKTNLPRHKRSEKHLNYLNSLENKPEENLS